MIDRTSCHSCTNVLIKTVEDATNSPFILYMDFSGNSLLQPTEEMMIFFRILLSVYMFYKPTLAQKSLTFNVLSILLRSSWKVLAHRKFVIPFCEAHNQKLIDLMILSAQKTFMKSFIVGVNDKMLNKTSTKKLAKDRKRVILSQL